MSTMKDVAEYAGVSITTVSHVINQTRHVSEDLQEKVLSAMEALAYQPNELARGLRMSKTTIFGLIIPDGTNPYFAEIARSIEDSSYQKGYSVIICNSDGDLEKEKNYIDVLVSRRVDGIIFVAAGVSSETMQSLQQREMPFVMVDRDSPNVTADSVQIDNTQGGYLATRYLIENGHRRIACIAAPSEVTPSRNRVLGYTDALREANVAYDEELVQRGDFKPQSGYRIACDLLSRPSPPTAFFACNDLMAFGVLGAAAEMGLRVPQDVSIIGFDNITLSEYTNPPLSTIAQPKYEMGELAVNFLLQRIKHPEKEASTTKLSSQVVVRKSTGPLS